MKPLLKIQNLRIGFHQKEKEIYAVNGIDLEMHRGETLAIVGESGCGKTLTAYSVMGLLGAHANMPNAFVKGSILLNTDQNKTLELVGMRNKDFNALRGSTLSMIFQEPMTALNPLLTVGEQVAEMLVRHKGMSRAKALAQTIALFEDVGIPEAGKRMKAYPHQMSGGQKQRVMIAMAMSCEPALLIADEPTTALDVTVQSQILYLLRQIKQSCGTAIMFITHNLGIVAQFAEKVAVMYRGIIVERGSVERVFRSPGHPYTGMLLHSLPKKGLRAVQGHRLEAIRGTVPGPSERITGCPFHERCPYKIPQCSEVLPPEHKSDASHMVRCFFEGGLVN